MLDSSSCADAQPQLGLAEHTFSTPTTFHDLFRSLKRFVDQAAFRYQRDRVDIEDLKQVGYIALWNAHQSYKPEKGIPIEHYARRAVVNEMLKESQRDHPRQEVLYHDCTLESDDSADRDDASVIGRLTNIETEAIDPVFQLCAGQEVSQILCGPAVPLTDSQRQVLDLLFRQGFNVQEAANLLGVSHQRVSKQQHKAIAACRSHLGVTVH